MLVTTLRQTMLLDPPWNESGGGKSKRGADRHYPLMRTPEILETVMGSGLWTPDARSCSVWMWATVNYLDDAIWLMEKLGAHYVTNAVWVKANVLSSDKGERAVIAPQAPGLGQRLRMCHEHLLFGRIGKVAVPAPCDRMPSVFYAPRTKHSVKPDEAFKLIERHDGEGSRLEWFARSSRSGWDAWGSEVGSTETKLNLAVELEQLDAWAGKSK